MSPRGSSTSPASGDDGLDLQPDREFGVVEQAPLPVEMILQATAELFPAMAGA